MRIETWNIQGMAPKNEVFKEIAKLHLDIIAYSETKK